MIRIGNREVIFSETLLCPLNDSIDIGVKLPDESSLWSIKILFTESPPIKGEKTKPTLNYMEEAGVWTFTFDNWANTLGATIGNPVEIAQTSNNLPITLLAEVAKLTNVYRINLQLMIGREAGNA